MDYVVLARKLRPMRFQDLIGQETVARALRNAILADRVAHAFLFAGSRGVGKTSAARILTKALNCLNQKEGEPCNACLNCEEITRDASPDVYEIDAASNRGIDNIRELRENTKYVPAKFRYKIYIIDEVHMLTTESFNALLKTLEEPPEHIKFILATTNPHRIPETILSRCQRFDFGRIPLPLMVDYLAKVVATEGFELPPDAIEAIARNAEGGMRDALTALDQVISFAGPTPKLEEVLEGLGLMDTREVLGLLGAVLDKSLGPALETFAAIHARGHDLTTLLAALLRDVKDFSLYLTLEGRAGYFKEHPPATVEFFEARKEAVTLDELQQIFYLLLEVEGQLKLSQFPQTCFEMALVKACRVEPLVGVPELLRQARALLASGKAASKEPIRGSRSTEPSRGSRSAAVVPSPSMAPASGNRASQERTPNGPPAGSRAGSKSGSSGVAPPPASPPRKAAPDAPSESTEIPEPVPIPEGPLLCDDERWRSFVERVRASRPKLAAELRRAEVLAISAESVEVLPASQGAEFSEQELEFLQQSLAGAFGPEFRLQLSRDSNREARIAYTIVGRERQRQSESLAAEQTEAAADEAVQQIRRFFPNSEIADIQPSTPPTDRRKDV